MLTFSPVHDELILELIPELCEYEYDPHMVVLTPPVEDTHAFYAAIDKCFDDQRIIGYLDRKLVGEKQVRDQFQYSDALDQAISLDSYAAYYSLREKITSINQKRTDILNSAQVWRLLSGALLTLIILIAIFQQLYGTKPVVGGVLLISAVLSGTSGYLVGKGFKLVGDRLEIDGRRLVASGLLLLMAFVFPLIPYFLLKSPWDYVFIGPVEGLAVYLLTVGQSPDRLREILSLPSNVRTSLSDTPRLATLKQQWLYDFCRAGHNTEHGAFYQYTTRKRTR